MSPTTSPANCVPAESAVAAEVLRDDETILLAVKPSGWFVLLASGPVLVLAALLAGGTLLARPVIGARTRDALLLAGLAMALLRLMVASFQWLGRTYMLTDKRVMRVRGVMKADVLQCPLGEIRRIDQTASRCERLLGVGSLLFQAPGVDAVESAWVNIARPDEVREAIEEAIRRMRGRDAG